MTRSNRRLRLKRLLTVVFAMGFVASFISTISAFAAANLFKIQNAELSELSATAQGAISSFDEENIVSDVTFHKLGDFAKYTITLKNTDSKDHVIESITDDNENPYVSYEYDQHSGEQIDAGADLVFVVTAKYATAVTDINARAQATNVKFYIHFTDLEEEVPVVPDTGVSTNSSDHLQTSVVSLVIFATGLIVIGIIALKKHKRASKYIIAGIIAVAAVAMTATVKAATTTVNSFTLTTDYGFFNKLVVTYADKDGNEQELIVNYGEPANIPDQSKDGYTLTGWEDEHDNPVDLTQPITEDIKIHPIYRAHTYTIKFNGNGANGEMADLAMTYDETKTLPTNAFNFPGRTYAGWDTEANGSGAHYDEQAEVKNLTTEDNGIVTLYAQWSINPFHIDYDGNGATSGEMASTNCEYDQTCQLRDNAFEKYGYDFAGWKYNDTIYADKADVTNIIDKGTITMAAQWTPHVYTITYTGLTAEEAAALRTAGNPNTYTIESPSFTLKNPEDRKDADGDTRERFVGWVEVIEPSTSVTLPMVGNLGNKTFNATWETVALPEYDITYNYNGGTVATANPTKLNKEQSATLNEPVKTGYAFAGWTGTTISGDTPVKPYTIPAPHQKGNLEYTAHYRAHTYTVNFDINTDDTNVGGTMQPLVLNYDEEKALTANAFTRTGYTFAGWKLGDTEYTDGQSIKNLTAEDGATVTLRAQWEANKYKLVFHANNGNVTNPTAMTDQEITYDVATAINPNSYDYPHYKFMGWATTETGAVVYEDGAEVTNLRANNGDIVDLYAVWKERTATLTQGWNNTAALKRINADATSFEHWTGETPDFDSIDGEENIALSTSNFPVYAWTEDNKIYWWSEATTIYMNASSVRMFSGMEKLQSIDISQFDSSLLTGLEGMFENTTALTSINFGNNFQTGNVTNFRDMFLKAKSLTELDLHTWDVSSFNTDLRKVFNGCSSLTSLNLDGWDLSHTNTTGTHDWLAGTNSLQTFSMKGGKLPSNANSLFADLKATTINLDNLDTSRVTDMQKMFARATGVIELDLHTWDVSNVQNMYQMFIGAKFTGINIDGWQTSSLTNIVSIFNGCVNLVNIDLSNIDTSKVQNMEGAFMQTPITTLDLSTWDTSKNTSVRTMFSGMKNVETIYVGDGWSTELITGANDSATLPLSDMTNKLVGGAGTVWSDNKKNGLTYLHLDDPCDNNPGLFSKKNARYVCYYSNIPEGEANAGTKTGDYLMIEGGSLATNTFTRDGYVFGGWNTAADGSGESYTDEQVMADLVESKTPLNLYAVWEPKTLTITFDKNDTYAEGEMGTQTVTYAATETLNTNTFTNYQHTFLGWNTQADGKGTHYDNRAEIEITIPHDFTLYAEWQAVLQSAHGNSIDLTMLSADKANEDVQIDEDTKCKRAVQLHEEICESGHCTGLGYTETGDKGTKVVRYGSFGTQGGPLNSGDAFTCDVDGNGVFDEKYERFYYVSDYWNTKTREFEGDTAVLIYYRSTYLGQGTTNQATSSYSNPVTSGPSISNLPKSSLWQNVSLKNTKRNILAFREGEEMTITIEDFDYEGYSARLLTIPEAKAGCNVATIQGGEAETDSTCMYMYENSRFVINDMNKTESIGVPLENTYIGTTSSEDNYRWFIQSRSAAGFHPTSASTRVSMRPVIEVPKNKISY